MHSQNDQAAKYIAGVFRDWIKKPKSYWEVSQNMRELACQNGHEQLWAVAQKMLQN